MMKFFRKYNKHLLAIFMVLLLIVWLGGQAIQNLFAPNPLMQSIGTVGGHKLIQGDLKSAGDETRILQSLGLPWMKPWLPSLSQARFDFNPPIDEMDWLLLRHEADTLGLGITKSQVDSYKQALGMTATDMARIANRFGVSEATIDSAIADFLRIRSTFTELQSAIFVPEPELRTIARNVGETVTIRSVGLPAALFIDDTEPIDEARIKAQFEKWKDVLPGEGDLGAGFRHPDRVEIEYVVANADAVAPTVAISRDEAKEYWQKNKKKFLRPKTDEPESQPADENATSQPASQPAEPPYYETFMEAEPDVLAELRKNRAPNEAQRLLSEMLTTEVIGDWNGIEPDAITGFLTAPDVAKGEDYLADRVERFVKAHPVYKNVFQVHRTPLVSSEQLAKLPGVGNATAPVASDTPFIAQEIGIAQDAFDVQGLVKPSKDRSAAHQPLSLYQFSPKIYRDDTGSAYVFRVVRVVPSAPPTSLNEVRDAVVHSLRIESGFERARKAASDLLNKAEETSLKLAWLEYPDLPAKLDELRKTTDADTRAWGDQLPPKFARRNYAGTPPTVMGIQSEDLVDGAFEAAKEFDPSDPKQKPHTVVELPKHQLILVLAVEDFRPLYESDFQARRQRDQRFIVMQRNRQLVADWFDPKNIRARVDYKPPA